MLSGGRCYEVSFSDELKRQQYCCVRGGALANVNSVRLGALHTFFCAVFVVVMFSCALDLF